MHTTTTHTHACLVARMHRCCLANPARHHQHPPHTSHAPPRCSQLLLGFLLPTLYIWRTELRQRRAFLAQHVETQVARGRAPPRREAVPTLIEYSMFAAPAGGLRLLGEACWVGWYGL